VAVLVAADLSWLKEIWLLLNKPAACCSS